MKGLKYMISLGVIFFTVLIGMGASSGYAENLRTNPFIKVTQIAEAFYQKGINVSIDQNISTSEYIIGDKLPHVWTLPGNTETLFIYEFPTVDDEQNVYTAVTQGLLRSTQGFKKMQDSGTYMVNALEAKNILVIYAVKYDPKKAEQVKSALELEAVIKEIAPNMDSIKQVVFGLNGGQLLKYRANGKSWLGKIELEYYQYSYTDQEGNTQFKTDCNETFYLKYSGTNTDSLLEVICSYDGPTGFGHGVFNYQDQYHDADGYIRLGSSNKNQPVNPNGKYVFDIKWGDGNEMLVFERVE